MSIRTPYHAPLPAPGLGPAMSSEHDEINALFDLTLAAFRRGDRDEAREAFTTFEQRLEAHLAYEDDVLLPSLRRDHPAEAAELAAEHHRIRARLMELGVCVELHLARASWVAEFIDLLRGHARREDALLHRWASEPAPVDASVVLHRLATM
jgi:hypothetical protein